MNARWPTIKSKLALHIDVVSSRILKTLLWASISTTRQLQFESKMPNKILNQPYAEAHHKSGSNVFATHNNNLKSNDIRANLLDDPGANAKQSKGQIMSNQEPPTQQQTNILNVAEMLLHGVADSEILTTWLQSIACQDFAANFLNAGYDMPTISRITPQDLTAIGITDPAKRLKILGEIKKLNLQDGIPAFKPANLNHWLSLLRLDSCYFDLLCDQQIDTIEKMCQLTWEDFEELGITKLGHQKRLILAIERMKEMESNEDKKSSKTISEPIYDTNPSQILLVASAENHSMNGPIINKQSSTSELSSSGSGSMHSVYSANSMHHQTTYATMPPMQQHHDHIQNDQIKTVQHVQNQQQAIYSQSPSSMIQQIPLPKPNPQAPLMPPPAFNQQDHCFHYQASQPIMASNPQLVNQIYDTSNLMKRNSMVPQSNRQSLGQLPFGALAKLPKHQQQMLKQSSLYATLGRQPQRVKQPPPPVPVRTNSLKSNSLVDEAAMEQQTVTSHNSSSQTLSDCHTNSVSSRFRSGARIPNKNQTNSHPLLTKNKSFSGNAYMDAARARFMNRNNYQEQQHPTNSATHQIRFLADHDQSSLNEFNYGIDTNFSRFLPATGHLKLDSDSMSVYSRQSLASAASVDRSNTFNLRSSDIQAMRAHHQQQAQQQQQLQLQLQLQHRYSASMATNLHAPTSVSNQVLASGEGFDPHSDTNSTKSLILQPSAITNSPVTSRQMSLSQDSDSSQTLYNSASSGSNDRNLNGYNHSQADNLASLHSIASNSTLNDVNLILDQTVIHRQDEIMGNIKSANLRLESDATTGKDDNFPPPPSPLSLTDSEENDLRPLNHDKNFADINNRLMAFRVGGL